MLTVSNYLSKTTLIHLKYTKNEEDLHSFLMSSTRQSFNRTRNDSSTMDSSNRNHSNGSDFQGDRNNGTGSSDTSYDESPKEMLYLLSTLTLPAVICFAYVVYSFLRLPDVRNRSSNFLIISLLIINLIHMLGDLPIRLFYLSQNSVPISSRNFCLLWTWFDNLLTSADLLVVAFTSIERYLFVFHHRFVRHYKRLFYYSPLIVCLLVPTIWYSCLIFAYPCRNNFIYDQFQCGTRCYLTETSIYLDFENFALFIFPLFIIVVANSSLIISVLIQKQQRRRRHRVGIWRRNLRMISQLVFIAVLYLSIYIPSCILLILSTYVRHGRFQPWALSVRTRYFTHLKYLIIFGCPFVILAGQRDMHGTLKSFYFCCKQKRQINPMTHLQTTPVVDSTVKRQ